MMHRFKIFLKPNGWAYFARLIRNSVKTLFHHGPRSLAVELKSFYARKFYPNVHTDVQSSISPVIYTKLERIKTIYVSDTDLRINLILPCLDKSNVDEFAKSLTVSTLLADELEAALRIICLDSKCNLTAYYEFINADKLPHLDSVASYDASWRLNSQQGLRLEVSKQDLFITTDEMSRYHGKSISLRKKTLDLNNKDSEKDIKQLVNKILSQIKKGDL